MLDTRRVWFPLRSNISYFDTSSGLDIESRVKQMALLSDELWFERGIVEVMQGQSGIIWETWAPPEQFSEDRVRRRREAPQGAHPPALPLTGGSIVRSYVAEYHLLVEKAGLGNVSWVQWPLGPPDDDSAVALMTADFDSWDPLFSRAFPTADERELFGGHLRKSLNRDLVMSAAYAIPAMIGELYRPILEVRTGTAQKGIEGGAIVGTEALQLWAPNFTDLPWKRIIELHDHEAIGEFRAKIAEAEEQCANLSGEDRALALKDIGYQAALQKAGRLTPGWVDIGVDVAAGALIDIVPWGGTIYSATTGIAKVRREQSDWTAVLLTLNQQN